MAWPKKDYRYDPASMLSLARLEEDIQHSYGLLPLFHQRKEMLETEIAELEGCTAEALVALRNDKTKLLKRKQSQEIYIIQLGSEIKVGTSTQTPTRIATHETATGQTATVLARFEGDEEIERRICSRFDQWGTRGNEWFEAQPVLGLLEEYDLPDQLDELVMSKNPLLVEINFQFEFDPMKARALSNIIFGEGGGYWADGETR